MFIHRLSERPDLLDRMHEVDPRWPEFMGTDPVVNAFFGQVAGTFPHLCAVATDASDAVVATGRAMAFARDLPGRGALPDGGLDRVMVWAFSDRLDWAALRPHRGRDRARSAGPRALRRGTRSCCLRRAQRLGRACAQRRPTGLKQSLTGPARLVTGYARDDRCPRDIRSRYRPGRP
jgi:hypothetical protein